MLFTQQLYVILLIVSLSLRLWVYLSPMTGIHVGLLGPCFKTGRVEFRLGSHRES